VTGFGVIADFPEAAPVAGFAGGLLIGVAAALMLLGLGRIAGVSGLLARATAMADTGPPRALALAFVAGLPLGAWLLARMSGGVAVHMPAVLPLVIGGLLVGFGTRLGSGCTSGHGVCGLARLSPRSALATVLFMGSGFATVALSHWAG
jgi:uncharacterized membrane protein YedE/YeeE